MALGRHTPEPDFFRREGGRESSLTRAAGNGAFARALEYDSDQVRVTLTLVLEVVKLQLQSGATAPAEPVSVADARRRPAAVCLQGPPTLPPLL
jgi:hypothetical protein